MSFSRGRLILVALIVSVALVLWVRGRANVPSGAPASGGSPSPTSDGVAAEGLVSPRSSASPVSASPPPTGAGAVPDVTARSESEIQRCVGSVLAEPGLRGALRSIRSRWDPSPEKLQYRNWHLELPTGSRRRMQLLIENNEKGGESSRLRWYSVDDEDLPIPVEIPPDHARNPSEAVLASYLAQGKVVFDQKAMASAHVRWVTENDEIRELEWLGPSGHLTCARPEAGRPAECDCR